MNLNSYVTGQLTNKVRQRSCVVALAPAKQNGAKIKIAVALFGATTASEPP